MILPSTGRGSPPPGFDDVPDLPFDLFTLVDKPLGLIHDGFLKFRCDGHIRTQVKWFTRFEYTTLRRPVFG